MKRALAVLSGLFLIALGSSAQLLNDGKRPFPWLGMGIRSFRDPSGQRFLHVDHIASGGPAELAGVQPGDIVTEIGGSVLRVGDDLDFLMFLAQHKPGDRLPLRIARYGRTLNIVVRFASMPESVRPAWNQTVSVARRKRLAAAQAKTQ